MTMPTAELINTIASVREKVAAAKRGDPEGEDVMLTLAELVVIEDALDMLQKVILTGHKAAVRKAREAI